MVKTIWGMVCLIGLSTFSIQSNASESINSKIQNYNQLIKDVATISGEISTNLFYHSSISIGADGTFSVPDFAAEPTSTNLLPIEVKFLVPAPGLFGGYYFYSLKFKSLEAYTDFFSSDLVIFYRDEYSNPISLRASSSTITPFNKWYSANINNSKGEYLFATIQILSPQNDDDSYGTTRVVGSDGVTKLHRLFVFRMDKPVDFTVTLYMSSSSSTLTKTKIFSNQQLTINPADFSNLGQIDVLLP